MRRDDSTGACALAVSIRPEFTRVSRENPAECHVLVSLGGRHAEPSEERKPLRLAVAADLSGSMQGVKVEYLRASLQALVRQLTVRDRITIVAFSSSVWTVAPPTACDDLGRARLEAMIDTMTTHSCTNLSGGALEAVAKLREMMGEAGAGDAIGRVLLMTDGLPNEGVFEHDQLVSLLQKACGRDTALSAFGYGEAEGPGHSMGDYDPVLLDQIARACGGNYHHINGPDRVAAALGQELGGLMTVVAQAVKLRVHPNDNVAVTQVLNDLDVETREGVTTINVNDMFAGEQKAVVLRVSLPSFNKSVAGARPRKRVLAVHAEWIDARTALTALHEEALHLEFVAPGQQDTVPDAQVHKQVALLRAADKQRQATEAARRGEFDTAQRHMQEAVALLEACELFATDNELRQVHGLMKAMAERYTPEQFDGRVYQRGVALSRAMHSKRATMDGAVEAVYASPMLHDFSEHMKDVAEEILVRKRGGKRAKKAGAPPQPPEAAEPPAGAGYRKTRSKR